MDESWLGLQRTTSARLSTLPVDHRVSGARGHLFGGCAVAAVCAQLESDFERPMKWLTCQFLSAAMVGDVISLETVQAGHGRRLTQVSGTGSVDAVPQMNFLGALGQRQFANRVDGRPMPAVSAPDVYEVLDFDPGQGGLNDRIEVRGYVTEGSLDQGQLVWVRFRDADAGDAMSIAVVADLFPPSIGSAVGRRVYGASLDNTIRFVDRATCDWLLVEMRVDSLVDGIGHGTCHVWAEDGKLLAIATQTCAVSAAD